MKAMATLCAAAVLVVGLPAVPGVELQGQVGPGDAPAAQRAAEVVELVNAADPDAIRSYVETMYSPGLLEMGPMDMHVGIFGQVLAETGGLDVHEVELGAPGEARVLVRARATEEWIRLSVRVEPEPPHRVAGLGLAPADPPAGAAPPVVSSDAELVRELEAYLARLAADDAFSGAVLLARGDRVLYEAAYGEANKDFGVANAVDTKFNLGSMNKMFTAVAIAQLVEAGRLSFDDPLSEYLPDFPDEDAARRIRIEHLLTHTSGLGSYFNEEFMHASRADYRTVDDFMELARGESLAFEPGTRWRYSNTGFLVLGKVIEVVTGQSYHDYVREHIHRPAGMADTDAYELDRVNPNLAVGYDRHVVDGVVEYRNNLFEHVIRGGPAGGGYSTVRDLFRFASALLAHELVGRENTELLLTPKPDLGSPSYGYGFGIREDPRVVGHSGGFPGISAMLDIYPDLGYTVVVLSNYSRAAEAVARRIGELVIARQLAAAAR